MPGLSIERAGAIVRENINVTREDIARAKDWIIQHPGTNVSGMAADWLRQQGIEEIKTVNTDAADAEQILVSVARTYSIRLAFYYAIWELLAVNELFAVTVG